MIHLRLHFASALLSTAILAGCAGGSAEGDGPRDLRGQPLALQVGSTELHAGRAATTVVANGRTFTVEASGARVTVTDVAEGEVFWVEPDGDHFEIGGQGGGQSYAASVDAVEGETASGEALREALVVGAGEGTLMPADVDRLDVVLPIALTVTEGWASGDTGGGVAKATVEGYAAALLYGPRTAAGGAKAPGVKAQVGGSSCSVVGNGCSCRITCSNATAACTATPTCACTCKVTIGPTGPGGQN